MEKQICYNVHNQIHVAFSNLPYSQIAAWTLMNSEDILWPEYLPKQTRTSIS